MDCTACKEVGDKLVKMINSYKQQIASMEFQLRIQEILIEKQNFIKNEKLNDEENICEGKEKGGKGYIKKISNVEKEKLHLKQQYMSKLACEKKIVRSQQFDDETQYMICKIDALRGHGRDNSFINKIVETFEGKIVQLDKLKKTIRDMKQLENEYEAVIDELMDDHQKLIEEKNQEIHYLRNVQVVLVEKRVWLNRVRPRRQKN